MDHPCYKCGHSIEDGKPFCAQCGAPQIRVAMPEPAAPPVTGNIPSSDLAVFSMGPPPAPGPLSAPALSTGIDWTRALRACAIAALIAALVMALGLMVPLLAVLGAGFLAVTLYRRQNPAWSVNARSGAHVGAVCGLLFFGIAALFETLAVAVFHTGGQIRQKMLEALQQAASRSTDPQVQAAFDRLKTPDGLAAMFVLGMVVLFLVSIAAGSLAGALTGAFLARRNRL
ncbi:MAG: zinc ribbon domain-containing protein [Candidatus Sulfotelmatobacter sp.]